MDRGSLTASIKHEALRLGFSRAGVCPAVTPGGIHRFRRWLESGYAGQMKYLPERAAAYQHPSHVMDGARSLVMLAMNYHTEAAQPTAGGQGRVSCYAWGEVDYHDLIHDRLQQLADFLRSSKPGCHVRGVVDTAPLLEREFAQLAGLGWIGKNTMLLNRELGSWFFLAVLLTDVELEYDQPFDSDHCGTCRACLDACPTAAFPQPYVLDATRCISYLTIELRGAIPADLRGQVGDWLFGCDICQTVCPWNHRAVISDEPELAPRRDQNPLDLVQLFEWDEQAFRQRFRRTPLWRAKRRGILRNAAVVLGNAPTIRAVSALSRGLADEEPLVRAACAWALGRYQPSSRAADLLTERLTVEADEAVQDEIARALRGDSS